MPGKPAELEPPWPDLVVCAGRQSAPYARLVSKLSRGQSFSVVLQDSKAPPHWFDFLWVNTHDKTRGENVMHTLTSPHRITKERLSENAARLSERIAPLSGPFIGLVLGGSNSVFPFPPSEALTLAEQTAQLAKERGAAILVTPSRRTGKDRLTAVKAGLGGIPHWIWNEEGENPYFGILGLADELVVTSDSVNMLGEAASTGKPVHMARLSGSGKKFTRFHDGLLAHGAARWLEEASAPWSYPVLDARLAVANEILCRYDRKKRQTGATDQDMQ